MESLSEDLKNFRNKEIEFGRIFTYKWEKIQKAFPQVFLKLQDKIKINLGIFKDLVEDCFNGYSFH